MAQAKKAKIEQLKVEWGWWALAKEIALQNRTKR